ncbi:MAG: transferase [Hyphomicrobiales bacterium]|nr:MAG: transferase [Hyphomicrobiales bacterium]
MPITITDQGSDNTVDIDPAVAEGGSGSIVFLGRGGTVRIGSGCLLSRANITIGSDCSFEVDDGCRLAAIEVRAHMRASVVVGAGTNFTWHTRLFLHEPSRIIIGRWCLIASDTLFTTSDMHSILNRATGERINPAADIVLGDHVWVALQATILKGSIIDEGSIVGLGSVVSGRLPANTLCAGRPARPIRENVSWDPALL